MQSSQKPLRGVNLGGWLVLEQWMTPHLFAGTDAKDEYTFMQTPDAAIKIKKHRDSFITEEDFRWLAGNNYNAVRIPVGYWIFNGDNPFTPCIDYLDWAIKMATKYNLHALICLHGAPGSQNGHDHSGRIGGAEWYNNPTYRQQTIDVISRLAARYKQQPAVWGIELLNEPNAWRLPWVLRRYHKDAYKAIQSTGREGLVTVFSDGFMPRYMSGTLKAVPEYPVMMDTHWYHFFMPKWVQRRLPFAFYQWQLRRRTKLLIRLSKAQPVIMGEWSGVIGGEALSRFDTSHHKELTYRHLRDQQRLFSHLAGWFYWNYKTERRGIFHYRSMNEDGHTEPPF
ncbi:MAG TPA: cellulase family glycosylhydrolase [Candidatus Saccharibacteria bacterium]|nr:cellulase family glycosylhydrolase [Candidatus Saccharibacteria bacterium]